jgi:hypothetical protein
LGRVQRIRAAGKLLHQLLQENLGFRHYAGQS